MIEKIVVTVRLDSDPVISWRSNPDPVHLREAAKKSPPPPNLNSLALVEELFLRLPSN